MRIAYGILFAALLAAPAMADDVVITTPGSGNTQHDVNSAARAEQKADRAENRAEKQEQKVDRDVNRDRHDDTMTLKVR